MKKKAEVANNIAEAVNNSYIGSVFRKIGSSRADHEALSSLGVIEHELEYKICRVWCWVERYIYKDQDSDMPNWSKNAQVE